MSAHALARLVALPFERERYLPRVKALTDRYRLLLLAQEGGAADRRSAEARLLTAHPSGLRELTHLAPGTGREELARRREEVEVELRALRAAAPLPAPLDRPERGVVLALADVEHWTRELIFLRRGLAFFPAAPLAERYALRQRPDPLEGVDEALVRALGQVPRGRLLTRVLELAAARHGVPGLLARFLPPASPPSSERVYVCPAAALAMGTGRVVEAFGGRVAVFRSLAGLFAVDDRCPHRGGSLGGGELEDGAVVCPLHGWTFDLASGRMRGNDRLALACFAVEEGADGLYVRRRG